jgi:hypothetical protein
MGKAKILELGNVRLDTEALETIEFIQTSDGRYENKIQGWMDYFFEYLRHGNELNEKKLFSFMVDLSEIKDVMRILTVRLKKEEKEVCDE